MNDLDRDGQSKLFLHDLHAERHRGSNKPRRNNHRGEIQRTDVLYTRWSVASNNGKLKSESKRVIESIVMKNIQTW
jgi:hypothetical protein